MPCRRSKSPSWGAGVLSFFFALNEGSGSVANDGSGACNSAFINGATFGTVLGRSGLSFDGEAR